MTTQPTTITDREAERVMAAIAKVRANIRTEHIAAVIRANRPRVSEESIEKVLEALRESAGPDGSTTISNPALSAKVNLAERTCQYALEVLRERGVVRQEYPAGVDASFSRRVFITE